MKRIIVICLIAITSSCAAQKANLSTDIPDDFFQRWQLDFGTDSSGNIISGLPKKDYEFKSDSTYIIYSANDEKNVGTWKYDVGEKVIVTMREDGQINGKIKDITADSFTLVPAGKAVKNTPFKDFRFHYKPAIE